MIIETNVEIKKTLNELIFSVFDTFTYIQRVSALCEVFI